MKEYLEQRRKKSEQTEQAILTAAMSLCRIQPFDKVSVRDICMRAGITTGAFYHHFRSKDDLLKRGFSSMNMYLRSRLEGHMQDPPVQRLAFILDCYVTYMENLGWQLAARYYQQRLETLASYESTSSQFTLQVILDCVRQAQTEGLLLGDYSPEWVADFVFRHYRGVVLDWVLSRGSYPLKEKLQQEYEFFVAIFKQQTDNTGN